MKVGILGATGAVGQKFIRLLQNHPWFEISVLGASARSAGKLYSDAANWIEDVPLPENIANLEVQACKPELFKDVSFVFSGLDSSVAHTIEGEFASAGIPVISNASNYRMQDNVPLLVPEINSDHLELLKHQAFTKDGSGWIVTNPNCVAVPLSVSLKPLSDAFGIDSMIVTTMQAISGAGYPGVPSLDILGNVVPFIRGEEPKIAPETQKVLGNIKNNVVEPLSFAVQATCTRVPTLNGHVAAVTLKLKKKPSSIDEIKEKIAEFNANNELAKMELPSAPSTLINVHEQENYPQPRLHADQAHGMQVHVGRIREAEVFDISFVVMAHNTIRGAAGGAILNAELLTKKGYIK